MAQLSNIISSILRDMVHAQHQANVYSMMMDDMYRENGALDHFNLPSVNMDEVEMEIRYGVSDASPEAEQYEINYPLLRKTAKKMAKSCARLMITSTVDAFRKVFENHNIEKEQLIEDLNDDIGLRERYVTFLSRAIRKALREATTSIVSESGKPDTDLMVSILKEIVEQHILKNEDMVKILAKIHYESVVDEIRKEIHTSLENAVPSLIEDTNFKRKRIIPSMEVVVSSEELSKLPEEAIHSLHIKLSPKNINLLLNDE